MSRSNPQEGSSNPAVRWFEWNGEHGLVRYYDRDTKSTVDVGGDFTFLLLDELASVRGWHDASQSGIYSNEVKDTTKDVLVVKSFKGGTLAEGLYKDIKLQVNNQGGSYVTNCYIAVKHDAGQLAIASLRFKGAALSAWMEFRKQQRATLYTKAIKIAGFSEGKKGRITYRVPIFAALDVSPQTHAAAVALDAELQEFLRGYLTRNRRDQADAVAQGHHVSDDEIAANAAPITDDDIPF